MPIRLGKPCTEEFTDEPRSNGSINGAVTGLVQESRQLSLRILTLAANGLRSELLLKVYPKEDQCRHQTSHARMIYRAW